MGKVKQQAGEEEGSERLSRSTFGKMKRRDAELVGTLRASTKNIKMKDKKDKRKKRKRERERDRTKKKRESKRKKSILHMILQMVSCCFILICH